MSRGAGRHDPVSVGRIVKPHGIRGEVVVDSWSDAEGRFATGRTLLLGERLRAVEIVRCRPHGGRWLVELEGVDDRDAAEALRDRELFVDSSELPELEGSTYWIHDLRGCELVTEDGERVGTVRDVVGEPRVGQQWLEVERPSGTLLVPTVESWLVEVDLEARRIVMRLPAGFVEVATS